VTTPTTQAVQAMAVMPENPITQGEMKNSTPRTATAPSVIIRPGLASDPSAARTVSTPRTIIVHVAFVVVSVQIGDRTA
jgi:hypothetical protein